MQYVAIHPDSESHVMAVARALFDHEPRNFNKRFDEVTRRTQDAYADKAAWVLSNASQALLSKGERVTADHVTASAFTENVKGAALASAALGALRPFAQFARMFHAKPLRGLDDMLYGIHAGTEWEAQIRLSDCTRAAEILKLAEPEKT